MIPPKVAQTLSQSDPISLGSTPRHPANQSSFRKGQIAYWVRIPASVNSPSLNMSMPSAKTTNPLA
jgi:hypothetical protein